MFVHDFNREVERVYSEEFLCEENLVEVVDMLAHFVVDAMAPAEEEHSFKFCKSSSPSSSSLSSPSSSDDDDDHSLIEDGHHDDDYDA